MFASKYLRINIDDIDIVITNLDFDTIVFPAVGNKDFHILDRQVQRNDS